jgi:hypothetical protein
MSLERAEIKDDLEISKARPLLQAFGKIVDPTLTYDSVKDLGDKLKPPAGRKYRIVVLDKDLTISTPQGRLMLLVNSTHITAPKREKRDRHDQQHQGHLND